MCMFCYGYGLVVTVQCSAEVVACSFLPWARRLYQGLSNETTVGVREKTSTSFLAAGANDSIHGGGQVQPRCGKERPTA